MNSADSLLQQVRAIDPLDAADVEAWWRAPDTTRLVDEVCAHDHPARRGRSARRRRRLVPLAVAIALTSAGAGAAVATGLLGRPAPDRVKAHLAELDRGMPADLRYDPDLDHARAVAASGAATLYLADLADGGYCVEVATQGSRPRGASCVPGTRLASLPLDVTAPIPDSDTALLVVAGRANDDRIAIVEARYADGAVARIDFGLDRAWLMTVPASERHGALTSGVTIVGLDDSRRTVTTVRVPPLHDDDPLGTAHDAHQPLVVTTTSDSDDLTLVLAIAGRVNVAAPTRLAPRFPDGSRLAVPVATDGTFHLRLPDARQDDFATTPGRLVVVRGGTTVASKPIWSVAAWRATHG